MGTLNDEKVDVKINLHFISQGYLLYISRVLGLHLFALIDELHTYQKNQLAFV